MPTLNDFSEITNSQNFVSVPDSWHIVVTDIVESTKAIASGHYKEVNLIGASSIIAVINLDRAIEIPFVFGGDGASMLIPPSLIQTAREVLLSTQQLAWNEFGLKLRVDVLPVTAVLEEGYEIKIAKLKVSQNYNQAIFTGGGLAYATELLKGRSIFSLEKIQQQKSKISADFSGLECRWQDIPGRHEEVVVLQVLAIAPDPERNNQIYREVLHKIQEIYGTSENFHPILPDHLRLSFDAKKLVGEAKIRTYLNPLKRQHYLWRMRLENLLGLFLMNSDAVINGIDLRQYKKDLLSATDYQKFDDTLRMIISGTMPQSCQLQTYLEGQLRSGNLVYGMHIGDRVLMTCVVFERNGRQVHFIDGANGGYTLAAKAMKQQMILKKLNWNTLLEWMRRKGRRDTRSQQTVE